MSTKTFGRLRYGVATNDTTGEQMDAWGLTLVPHVAIKAKRLFSRAEQYRTGVIVLADTPEVARDIEWFIDRYPLEVSDDTRARLTKRADEHRATEQSIEDILVLSHHLGTGEWQEPARPGRPYQTQAADLAWTVKGMILGDDVGLGKTQSGLMLLRDPATLPAAVVCMTHLPKQWVREINAIWPMAKVHVAAKTTPPEKPIDADIIVLSYSKMDGWRDRLAGQVKTVIFDEVQELRHPGTRRYSAAQHIAHKAEWKIGLSATPVSNYGDEIHNIYEVIAPGVLGTHTEFVREWGGRTIGYGGHTAVEQVSALGAYLRDQGLLLRRTRKDVKREIPEPMKIRQEVPANPEALEAVKGDLQALARLLLDDDTEAKVRWRAAGDMDWKLRHATGIAKAPAVAEFTRMLLETEEAVVLFGWHRDVYDIWNDRLAEFNPVMFTGSETPAQKQKMVDAFVGGKSRVLIMSLRSGAGIDGLQKRSSVAVFGELDWSPAVHDQAIGRLARDGQEAAVAAYFLVTGSGSDPVIADRLQIKTQQAEGIRNPDAELFAPNLGQDTGRGRALAEAILKGGVA